jgi:hypothetical protein
MQIVMKEEDRWKIHLIRELLSLRDGSLYSNLTDSEVNNTIDFLCTS